MGDRERVWPEDEEIADELVQPPRPQQRVMRCIVPDDHERVLARGDEHQHGWIEQRVREPLRQRDRHPDEQPLGRNRAHGADRRDARRRRSVACRGAPRCSLRDAACATHYRRHGTNQGTQPRTHRSATADLYPHAAPFRFSVCHATDNRFRLVAHSRRYRLMSVW